MLKSVVSGFNAIAANLVCREFWTVSVPHR